VTRDAGMCGFPRESRAAPTHIVAVQFAANPSRGLTAGRLRTCRCLIVSHCGHSLYANAAFLRIWARRHHRRV
jgi:hypothetical protein